MNDILDQITYLKNETITDEISSKFDPHCDIHLLRCTLECESIKSLTKIKVVQSWVTREENRTLLNTKYLSLNKCFVDDMIIHADAVSLHDCAGCLYTTKIDSLIVFGGCITVDKRNYLEVKELHLNRCLFSGGLIVCNDHEFIRPSSILFPGTNLVVLYDKTHCLLGGNTAIEFKDLGDMKKDFWWRESTEETKEICEEWQKVEYFFSENLDYIKRRFDCEY